MKKLYLFLKLVFFTVFFFVAVIGAGVFGLFWYFSKDLPKIESLKDYNPPVISEVYSDNGTKIGEFWIERRILLEPHEIPKLMEQAIIASEDDRFFEHSGIDYVGISRAMIENLKAGGIVQGGSTITQQVVKSFLLTKDRTYERKIKEAILAKRLEDKLTKREILYLYLNQIYFGNRAYGIEAAAQNYFRKTAKELNTAEAAMIAGLAKAPTAFSPIRNYKRAKERQEYVITRMYEENFISEAQMNRAKAAPLKIYRAGTDKSFNMQHAPWFVEEVRREIIKTYGAQVPYTHGLQIYTTVDLDAQEAANAALWKGLREIHKRHGYNGPKKNLKANEFDEFNKKNHKKIYQETAAKNEVIRSSLDEIWKKSIYLDQSKIYEALVTGVENTAIHVQVGKLKGKIVQRDFGWARKRNNRSRGYDDVIYLKNAKKRFRVGDVIEVQLTSKERKKKKAKFYSGDTTYFTLEERPKIEGAIYSYDPHSGYVKAIIGGKDFAEGEFNRATQAVRQTGSVFKPFLYASALDKGYQLDTIIEDSPIKIPDGPGRYWEPKNYGGGFKGPMTFKSALVASRNVVTVKIMLDVGTEYVTGLVRKLGITTKLAKVYSMSLGSNDMKPKEVARAFGVFPTGGVLPKLISIKRIVDRFGTTLEENVPPPVVKFTDQLKNGELNPIGSIHYEPSDTHQYLRSDLLKDAQGWVKRDKLNLTPYEEIILYGKHIPKGYVMNPRTAFKMVKIMQDIVNYGTGYKVRGLKRPAAGKTGTTNDLTDCWFVGYTPDLVAAVWTGYDQAKYKVGGGETGGKAAAPIFLYYMKDYLDGTKVSRFKIPKEINVAELDSPVQIYPGSIHDLIADPYGDGTGAEFFIDDI